jgi:hypothetical protein
MFNYASAFNQPLEQWDVSQGTNFYAMFYSALAFNQDLCAWNEHLQSTASVGSMFSSSACSTAATDPSYDTINSKFSPLCFTC